jgi:hypothetical protein
MEMAKATEEDMQAALDVSNILQELGRGYMPVISVDDGGLGDESDNAIFDIDDHGQCKEVLQGLLSIERRSNLFRASFGLTVLLDPRNKLVDPNADTLEDHPETLAAKKDAARYRFIRDVLPENLGVSGVPCVALPESLKSGDYLSGDDADCAIDAAILALSA